jgi:hypothetical protein
MTRSALASWSGNGSGAGGGLGSAFCCPGCLQPFMQASGLQKPSWDDATVQNLRAVESDLN